MQLIESTRLAFEGLSANKLRASLTMLGVIIGVAAVVLLLGISLTVRKMITSQIKGLGTNLFVVMPGNVDRMGPVSPVNRLKFRDAQMLDSRNSYNLKVAPGIFNVAIVKYGNRVRKTTLVVGTTPEFQNCREWRPSRGEFFGKSHLDSDRRVCLLGQTVWQDLFSGLDPIGKTIWIKGSKFRIIGIMESKGYIFDQNQDDTVFIPLTAAQDLFGLTNVSFIYLTTPKTEDLPKAMAEVKRLLHRRLDEDDFSVKSQGEFLNILENITAILTAMLASIGGISLLVGGIGIMNIMLVSVTERTREIGIRKAVGAKPIDILKQFLIEAVAISLTGGVIGILFSYLVTYLIASFANFAIEIPNIAILTGVMFSAAVGIFFGVYPARKAAKLDPIVALRYE
ncbi:MAG: ABC transporter permease [bacterium]|nr:ABC transporter permease [bacterium]